jgi:hypothetical protein
VVAPLIARGPVGSTLVVAGGLVTATLPYSTPVLHAGQPSAVLLVLRETTPGRMAGLGLVLVGLGLLATSWLVLCRRLAVRGDDPGGVELVRMATFAWCVPLLVAPPLFSRDGWSYAAQGMLAQQGLSPYEHGPAWLAGPIVSAVDPMWMHTPAPYGPLPLALGDLVAGVTDGPWLLVVAHRGFALVGLALLAWSVPRLAAWAGVNPALASALALASPFMLANGVAGLHNDLLMVGLMTAALVLAGERGWAWGAAVAGLAAAVKAPGAVVCLGIVLVSLPAGARLAERVRRAGAVAAVSAGVLIGLGVVTGLGTGWLGGLTVPAAVPTPLSVTTLVGTGLAGLTGAELFQGLTRIVGGLAAVGFAGRLLVTCRTGRQDVALAAVGAAMLAFVLLSPVVHLWYFLWAVPFLAARHLSRGAMTALVALLVIGGLVAPLDSSLHGAYLVIVFGVMLVAGLIALLLLTRRSRDRLNGIAAPGVTVLRGRVERQAIGVVDGQHQVHRP